MAATKIRGIWSAVVWFALAPALCSSGISLSFQSPSVKVFLDEPSLGTRRSYTVRMARGEYESFQLLLAAPGEDLRDVMVKASPLTPHTDSRFQVEIGLVGYVETRPDDRRPWGRAVKIGWWPDPLLPNRPFDVKAGETQPVWVTLFAPPGLPAGNYTGGLSVKAAHGSGAQCTYQVEIFNVDLPKRQRLRNAAFMPAGNLNAHYQTPGGLEGKSFLRLYKRWVSFAFQHHLGPAFDMLMGWNQTKPRSHQEAGSLGPTPDMTARQGLAGDRSYVTWPVRHRHGRYDFGTARELLDLGLEYGLEQFCIALFDRELITAQTLMRVERLVLPIGPPESLGMEGMKKRPQRRRLGGYWLAAGKGKMEILNKQF